MFYGLLTANVTFNHILHLHFYGCRCGIKFIAIVIKLYVRVQMEITVNLNCVPVGKSSN